jgi:hypothetical protein
VFLFFELTGAGIVQILAGTSSFSYLNSYFDDPRDAEMIYLGYLIFDDLGGCSGN